MQINVSVLFCFGIDINFITDKAEWEWGCLAWPSSGEWPCCAGTGHVGLAGSPQGQSCKRHLTLKKICILELNICNFYSEFIFQHFCQYLFKCIVILENMHQIYPTLLHVATYRHSWTYLLASFRNSFFNIISIFTPVKIVSLEKNIYIYIHVYVKVF